MTTQEELELELQLVQSILVAINRAKESPSNSGMFKNFLREISDRAATQMSLTQHLLNYHRETKAKRHHCCPTDN